MASSKRTRKSTPRGLEAIILKDLQCLHNWNAGPVQLKSELGDFRVDSDHLLCHETLADLESAWATPAKPKRAKKSQRKIKSKSTLTSRSTKTASPVPPSAAPPNSPADVPPNGQAGPNPYITFLINSWDSNTHSTGHKATSPNPASTCTVSGANNTSSAASQEEEEADPDLIMVNPDDVLVIPDNTRQQYGVVVGAEQSTPQTEEEQCVPADEGSELQSNSAESQELSEESLFVPNGSVSPVACQQAECLLDHVVPEFLLEEWFVLL